ncbi:MAG TPA: hypothetical protein DEB74_03935, partial [Lachnospiraceae bacterium]|nr:hypothetical protein [Lachnospiraceae bacterium]
MGSLVAPFDEKGNLQTHTTSGDSLKKNEKNKNAVDSDMFLTLLVAEMQNQDPLEPTSNTEWVSQYATFTQVQKMSEMAEAVDVLRANELIGKEVIVKTTSTDTGEVNYKQGIVDFVEIENGKPLLVIDNAKYSISDLDTVVSTEYSQAYGKYSTFKGMIDSLPDVAFADKSYENVIQGAFDFYNTMNDYEKNYMAFYGADQMEKFTQWKLELENLGIEFKDSSKEEENKTSLDDILESFNTKMNAIIDKLNLLSNNSSSGSTDKTEQDSDNKTEDTDKTNDSDKTGNTDKTDGTNKTEGSDNTNTGDTSGSDNTDNTSGSDSTNTDNTTGSDSTNDSD